MPAVSSGTAPACGSTSRRGRCGRPAPARSASRFSHRPSGVGADTRNTWGRSWRRWGPWRAETWNDDHGPCHDGGMKLYQTYTSPFPTRVRLAIYVKGLEAEIIEPPGFHATTQSKGDYLSINP